MKRIDCRIQKNIIIPLALCITAYIWPLDSIASSGEEGSGLPEQFSADVTIVNGKAIIAKRVFRDHGKLRRQAISKSKTANLQVEYWITDWDLGRQTLVWPILKKYMHSPMADPPRFPPPQEPWLIYAPRTAQVKLGREHIGNVEWTKYLVTNTFMTAWLYTQADPRLGMELRGTNGTLLCSWRNMVVGPQPPELFRIPEDYKRSGAMQALLKSGKIPPREPGALGRHLAALGLPDEFYIEEMATVLGLELRQKIWCKGDQTRNEVFHGDKRGWAISDLSKGIQMVVEDSKQRIIVMPLILCAGPVGSWEANLLWDRTAVIENQGVELVNGEQLTKRRLSKKTSAGFPVACHGAEGAP